jgi:hypothetical protein
LDGASALPSSHGRLTERKQSIPCLLRAIYERESAPCNSKFLRLAPSGRQRTIPAEKAQASTSHCDQSVFLSVIALRHAQGNFLGCQVELWIGKSKARSSTMLKDLIQEIFCE